jgi:hypothetical protein
MIYNLESCQYQFHVYFTNYVGRIFCDYINFKYIDFKVIFLTNVIAETPINRNNTQILIPVENSKPGQELDQLQIVIWWQV